LPATKKAATPKASSSAKQDVAQPSELTSMSLEDMLASALKDTPDIRVAEAKLREAESELNRIRLDAAQKVMAFRREWEIQKAKIEEYEARAKEGERLKAVGAISQEEWRLAKVNVEVNRLLLTKLEEQLPYLLGKAPAGLRLVDKPSTVVSTYVLKHMPPDQILEVVSQALTEIDSKAMVEPFEPNNSLVIRGTPETHLLASAIIRTLDRPGRQVGTRPVRNEMAEKIRKALNRPVKAEYKNLFLSGILQDFQDTFDIKFVGTESFAETLIVLDLGEVPLGLVLQAIHDLTGAVFDVRDYGILVRPSGGFRGGSGNLFDLWKPNQETDADRETVPKQ
jgi:hypothetical protein